MSLKNKIKRNLPAIITVAAIAGIVTATVISVKNSIAHTNEISEAINAGLADGTLTMIPGTNGIIHIVETASL